MKIALSILVCLHLFDFVLYVYKSDIKNVFISFIALAFWTCLYIYILKS